ncbi:uncharacterized protein AKAW2_30350A [Aspergillus luchuensis]|uniref:Uncharacterized protein n=1 Tax=Aspergillus kawachii TaxID=1069201 RepID=A0A7R7W622_ASPKA|nr:uncharacterized protein AKAW2_30350A [Aspergillus luchuensis]BCR97031.1 hypothetical protein AKAW2_30350A [Aspergillus luchuensis]BCS09508.1 hypothetical protein ALUC_30325A [Aspergillus luchuensis]
MGLSNCFKVFTSKRGRSRAKGAKVSPAGGPSSATAPATYSNDHTVTRSCKTSSSPQIPRLTSESMLNDDDKKKINANDFDRVPTDGEITRCGGRSSDRRGCVWGRLNSLRHR